MERTCDCCKENVKHIRILEMWNSDGTLFSFSLCSDKCGNILSDIIYKKIEELQNN